MKTIPSALLADLQADCTTLAFVWTIQMANGVMIRGTEHDLDITIPSTGDSPVDPYAGIYKSLANITLSDVVSNTDLSVDNSEVKGAFPEPSTDSPPMATVIDVTVDEIESGLLDEAPVTILVCNWAAPSHGYYIAKTGFLGPITRDSDGAYTTAIRGLTQPLSQTIIETFSDTCSVVKFGDQRCKFDVASVTVTGSVAVSSANLQQFQVSLIGDSPPSNKSFVGGILTFTSGDNAGFFREVKIDPVVNSGVIQCWEQFPAAINEGDTFTLSPGCDRTQQTCQHIYNNLVNNRAYGLFIPGVNAITAGPTTTTELGS